MPLLRTTLLVQLLLLIDTSWPLSPILYCSGHFSALPKLYIPLYPLHQQTADGGCERDVVHWYTVHVGNWYTVHVGNSGKQHTWETLVYSKRGKLGIQYTWETRYTVHVENSDIHYTLKTGNSTRGKHWFTVHVGNSGTHYTWETLVYSVRGKLD